MFCLFSGQLVMLVTILDFGDRIEILVTSDRGCCLGLIKRDSTFFVTNIWHLHRCSYFRTHKWTDKASISGTSFISIFALTIFTHRDGLSGSTPVPDNNVNSSTIPNQCAVQQGIYGVTSRVFILVLLGKDCDERATHRRLLRCHFGVCGGLFRQMVDHSKWLAISIWNYRLWTGSKIL